MTPEGRIMIDLFLRRNGGEVKIASSRPLSITRQFAGRRPDEVIRAVSLLFWTCKSAQSIAAVEAFEAALKRPVPEKVKNVRALLILAEIAREHALRIVIDWPKFLSVPEEAPPAAHVRAIMKIGQDFDRLLHQETNGEKALATAVGELRSFLEQAIFAEDLERWCERITQDALTEWAALKTTGAQRLVHQLAEGRRIAVCAVELRALPSLAPQELAVRLFSKESAQFIAQPDWEGEPCETSPLARHADHLLVKSLEATNGYGLGARLAATLIELAAIPSRMLALAHGRDTAELPDGEPGVGVAQIEAARGRLVHAVEMDGEKVGRYRILAPTEWNFHPQGAAATALARLASAEGDRESLARLFVTAVDPCVGYEVRVH